MLRRWTTHLWTQLCIAIEHETEIRVNAQAQAHAQACDKSVSLLLCAIIMLSKSIDSNGVQIYAHRRASIPYIHLFDRIAMWEHIRDNVPRIISNNVNRNESTFHGKISRRRTNATHTHAPILIYRRMETQFSPHRHRYTETAFQSLAAVKCTTANNRMSEFTCECLTQRLLLLLYSNVSWHGVQCTHITHLSSVDEDSAECDYC